jgi:AcrR family transcriptional regulator
MEQKIDAPVSTPSDEPAWKQRAIERSTQAAKRRAEQRVDGFLHAAQAIMTRKGTTDFTVQEVVDRAGQSLRSFYQHFDSKHELLLALFENAMRSSADQIRAAASDHTDPLEQVKVATQLLFELSRPDPRTKHPLFTDFAPRLLLSHSAEVKIALAPLLTLFEELMTQAEAAGHLLPDFKPRRAAALTMQTAIFIAHSNSGSEEEGGHPITAAEAWKFCASGITFPSRERNS